VIDALADGRPRCWWSSAGSERPDPLMVAYHDDEWGAPCHDDIELFERLALESFQAGLSWSTILRKRESFRGAFRGFDPRVVAAFDDDDRARLMADAGIIRSNAKIDAAIASARLYLDLREAGVDFADFCWAFTDGKPIQGDRKAIADVPAQTPLAVEVSKALKAKGFKFVGPVIVYAWMQAVGMVNDHLTCCHRHEPIRRMGA
jgi:DNA-3-methyladenine glycosylase I